MKLFCRDEMQRLEQAAAQAGTSLGEMMERAGTALADEVEKRCRPLRGRRVAVLCGKGNNGGDGFVCARVLQERGASCQWCWPRGSPPPTFPKTPSTSYGGCPGRRPASPCPGTGNGSGGWWRGGGAGGLRLRLQLPGGALRGREGPAGACQQPGLPARRRGPAQRRPLRHRPGEPGGLPGPRHGDLHREEARPLLLPRQGVLAGHGGGLGGGARRPPGGGQHQDLPAGQELPRPVAAAARSPVQQGQPGEASAGVRQLRHGGGLRHGRPGGAARRGGAGADRPGQTALPPGGPGGAPGGVPAAGPGPGPGRLGA